MRALVVLVAVCLLQTAVGEFENCKRLCTPEQLQSGHPECGTCKAGIIDVVPTDNKRQNPLQFTAQILCNYTLTPARTCVPCSFVNANVFGYPPVPNILISPFGGYISLVDVSTPDGALCGDWYLLYDNDVLLGPTSDPQCRTGAQCTANCLTSKGCYYLAPGVQHNITVKQGGNPYNSNVVGVFLYYYAASPADCSNSAPTDFQCTPLPPLIGPSPCDNIAQMPASLGCPTQQTEL